MKSKKSKKVTKIPSSIVLDNGTEYLSSTYEITDLPVHLKFENLPKSFIHKTQRIVEEIEADPKQAIKKLLVLKEEFPDVPKLYNYLANAYSRAGNFALARQITIENYTKNPEYLFAKINYAQICLIEGSFYEIPRIFNNTFDLKMIYPDRKKFHISEFAGFTGILIAYYCCINDKKLAEQWYQSLINVAPDSDMVRFAKRFLHPSLFRRIMNWLGKKKSQSNKTSNQLNQKQITDDSELNT